MARRAVGALGVACLLALLLHGVVLEVAVDRVPAREGATEAHLAKRDGVRVRLLTARQTTPEPMPMPAPMPMPVKSPVPARVFDPAARTPSPRPVDPGSAASKSAPPSNGLDEHRPDLNEAPSATSLSPGAGHVVDLPFDLRWRPDRRSDDDRPDRSATPATPGQSRSAGVPSTRVPALRELLSNDPRSSMRRTASERFADAVVGVEGTTEEHLPDGTVRLRRGTSCVLAGPSRAAEIDPVNNDGHLVLRTLKPCP